MTNEIGVEVLVTLTRNQIESIFNMIKVRKDGSFDKALSRLIDMGIDVDNNLELDPGHKMVLDMARRMPNQTIRIRDITEAVGISRQDARDALELLVIHEVIIDQKNGSWKAIGYNPTIPRS